MPYMAVHAPRQTGISTAPGPGRPTTDRISPPATTSPSGGLVNAPPPLTTYTSYTTTTFLSGSVTLTQTQGVPIPVSNSAQLASLSAEGALDTAVSSTTTTGVTGSGTASAAASTSSAASAHNSSSTKSSTLIPAIVVPIVVVLLLGSFAAFFLFMRRRHHRALEEEARFEKAKPTSTSRSSPADNVSSRNLISTRPVYGQSADHKPKLSTDAKVTSLLLGQATSPPRPRRPEEKDIPTSAIGVARSTPSDSAVPAKTASRPPRSAHEMRGLPTNPRPTQRGPRSPYLSGGDIIDSYAAMRPSTAPNGSARGPPPPPSDKDMRIPLPIKPMGRPPPKTSNPPPPSYTSRSAGQSPSSRTASPALWPASSQAHNTNSSALSRAQAGTSDSSYGLTEENLRIARLVTRSNSSLGMGRQAADNASVSDVDEQDQARAHRDDVSDISELDEEQEKMASGMNSPMGTGRGTPMSGRVGTPLSGRGYAR